MCGTVQSATCDSGIPYWSVGSDFDCSTPVQRSAHAPGISVGGVPSTRLQSHPALIMQSFGN